MPEPLAESILRKLLPYLSLEKGEVCVYAYDSGASFVLETSVAEREYLLSLGMEVEV